MIKGFNLPIDYILYELSYANLIMLSATLPNYDKEEKEEEEVLDMSNPNDQARIDQLLGIVD
jgi:hypothetical protein